MSESHRLIALALLLTLPAGCASKPLRIDRPADGIVRDLADVRLPRGADSIVQTVSGGTIRGNLESITGDRLNIRSKGWSTDRSLDHTDIALVARVVGMSKGKRGRLGAAIGALVSLAGSISMFADMIVPGAIVGALIGRSTGDAHAEVVFERQGSIVP